jgi:DNA sulfur modification protein DndD
VLGLSEDRPTTFLHDIGDTGRHAILERLSSVQAQAVLLRDALDRRERLYNELRGLETKIQSTSDDPYVSKLIQENRDVGERIGALEQEEKSIQGDIQSLESDLAKRSKQIQFRLDQREIASNAKRAVKLAQRVRTALDHFIKDLAQEKLAVLQEYMDQMYTLLKKPDEDPVRGIKVDPDTWQVVLYDDRGRPLEKRVFSQGMKQMYALSLLWALGRASGRELPIVIDTPVGRLDKRNRWALFEKYLPVAGHQVIVLSTDTEVDMEAIKHLLPYVARQYRLDYDRATDSTVVRPGYFF